MEIDKDIYERTTASFLKETREKDAKISSLITTIESQKEEIQALSQGYYRKVDAVGLTLFQIRDREIESLQQKIITRDKLISAQVGHIDTVNAHLESFQKEIKGLIEALDIYATRSHWTTAYYYSEHGRAKVSAMYRNNPWEAAQSAIQKSFSHIQEGENK